MDRLTRSLADFAKIVEILDAASASFVSVTQALNTTTSMGRLMLNVLLSFAQFEREMTGERIRDKIAASKKKGLWMGGPVPLGYIVHNRKLIVEEQEAETVRHIMRRYLALSSVNELVAELERDGFRTKVQRQASGPHRGGCVFRRGTLYHLLRNRIYLGEIVHKDAAYPGEHEPIVPMELWHEVQDKMVAQASGGARRGRVRNPSLLIGLIVDGLGRAMTPTHAKKGSRNYRYYVTRPEHIDDEPAWRVSAYDVEGLVCSQLADLLRDEAKLIDLTKAQALAADQTQKVLWAAERAASTFKAGFPPDKEMLLHKMIERVSLHDQQISIELRSDGLFQLLGLDPAEIAPIIISTAAVRVRRGHQIRLIIPGPATAKTVERNRDPKLVAVIADAVTARDLVVSSSGKSLQQIAFENGRCRKRLAKLLAVSFLAPDIVTAIVEGVNHPP
ncbi:recombinase family protein [Sphingomonas sp. SRS2]|uniref:recombinase family protein n=1 Tax=Sphingomonas sp. SRS2 TaxID=133190 RepID=UPI0022866B49|nr:recombinase family protein [Sphingomonas sp. SRS2]